MPNIGPMELIVVLVIALLVLGPKKLPEVGRSVGKGIREFKDSIAGGDDRDDKHPAALEPVAVQSVSAAEPTQPAAHA